MSLQQLEAFLARVQVDPSLERPLATAPDAAAVAAIAHAAGFAVTEADLLAAAGEPPEVLEVIDILAAPQAEPQSELDAFLQQVELDPDLQRVLASAPDAEAVAALARVAGYGVTAEDVWEASDEQPEALALVTVLSGMVVMEASGPSAFSDAPGADLAGTGWEGSDPNDAGLAGAEGPWGGGDAFAPDGMVPEEPLPLALEAFLRQAEVDPELQEALRAASDAAAVAEIACSAGFPVAEADLWEASDETPQALQEPPSPTELADPWDTVEPPAPNA
jgi:predicted ribosomally synthesized peptide with nif11-like leader